VIAINTNDPEAAPGDSFEKMQERAKENKFAFPYLFDEGQTVTNAYGATRTPHVFLISRSANGNTIEYTGAIDNDTENTNPDKTRFVEQATDALLKGTKPTVTVTKAIGCTIKRKKTN
jgi:peroxiredoxin